MSLTAHHLELAMRSSQWAPTGQHSSLVWASAPRHSLCSRKRTPLLVRSPQSTRTVALSSCSRTPLPERRCPQGRFAMTAFSATFGTRKLPLTASRSMALRDGVRVEQVPATSGCNVRDRCRLGLLVSTTFRYRGPTDNRLWGRWRRRHCRHRRCPRVWAASARGAHPAGQRQRRARHIVWTAARIQVHPHQATPDWRDRSNHRKCEPRLRHRVAAGHRQPGERPHSYGNDPIASAHRLPDRPHVGDGSCQSRSRRRPSRTPIRPLRRRDSLINSTRSSSRRLPRRQTPRFRTPRPPSLHC